VVALTAVRASTASARASVATGGVLRAPEAATTTTTFVVVSITEGVVMAKEKHGWMQSGIIEEA
jgi:uncharacterized protein YcnI